MELAHEVIYARQEVDVVVDGLETITDVWQPTFAAFFEAV
jgi:hypothetical protein